MLCAFAIAEVRKVTANLSQTCGFAVAEHLLQFCGICGCGIEFKFAVPSFAYMLHEVTNGRDPICNMKLPMVGTLYAT